MNRDELVALAQTSLTVDVVTAGKPFGLSTATCYRLAAAGDFPVPVMRVGRKYRVATAELLKVLGIGAPEISSNIHPNGTTV